MKHQCHYCQNEHDAQTEHQATRSFPYRVLLTAFPKAGTNLLAQLFQNAAHLSICHSWLHHDQPHIRSGSPWEEDMPLEVLEEQLSLFNGVAFGHIPMYEPIQRKFELAIGRRPTTVLFMIRDPRAVIASHLAYVKRKPYAGMNHIFPDGVRLSDRPDPVSDLIDLAKPMWEKFLGWSSASDPDNNMFAYRIKFEDFVADKERAVRGLCDILPRASHGLIGGDWTDMLKRIQPEASPTYSPPDTERWQDIFAPVHRVKYAEVMGDIHTVHLDYGWETDDDE